MSGKRTPDNEPKVNDDQVKTSDNAPKTREVYNTNEQPFGNQKSSVPDKLVINKPFIPYPRKTGKGRRQETPGKTKPLACFASN